MIAISQIHREQRSKGRTDARIYFKLQYMVAGILQWHVLDSVFYDRD